MKMKTPEVVKEPYAEYRRETTTLHMLIWHGICTDGKKNNEIMMRLNLSHLLMRRGSIVEISWDATAMAFPELVVNISGKESFMPVEPVGSKKLRINGGKLRNSISLRATDSQGKRRTVSRSIFVYGKAKNEYDSYTRISPLRKYADYVKDFWRRFPIEKRRLYIISIIMLASLMFMSSNPEMAKVLTIAGIIYSMYLIMKR